MEKTILMRQDKIHVGIVVLLAIHCIIAQNPEYNGKFRKIVKRLLCKKINIILVVETTIIGNLKKKFSKGCLNFYSVGT